MSKLVVGACAMDVKARSKPMKDILNRLLAFGEFEVVIFGDHVILEEPVESWPRCDILIAFFSQGFPLEKAVEYVRLRQPFCVNDVAFQWVLLDRRLVGQLLESIDVPTPKKLVVNRDDLPCLPADLIELISRDFNVDFGDVALRFPQEPSVMLDADTLQVGNQTICKPFVEKPANAEDHNIYIYYPQSMGGGCRKLFRKLANKSSDFCPDVSEVRTDRSYIYEEFHPAVNSEDVKVYTVGLYHAHAETRKSPVVDGIVRRNAEGKEIRLVTQMTCEEQEIARRVCMAFGQTICGFDILRTMEKSFVVDVNGWSFVKGNEEYYEKCAAILRDTFLRASISKRSSMGWKYEPFPSATEGQWRLKCYVAAFRHGDRTPKQKLKMTVTDPAFLQLLPATGGEAPDEKDILIRGKPQLVKAYKLADGVVRQAEDQESEECRKLKQLIAVLGKKMTIPGTKIQLRKIVRAPYPSMLLIVKWGGDFTHAGRHQTKDLGENLRKELTILNRMLLDDVKIFCSAERRVMATADVFAKAFLSTAEVGPAYISVMKSALDDSFLSKDDIFKAKQRVGQTLIGSTRDDTPTSGEAPSPRGWLSELKVRLASHRSCFEDNLANLSSRDFRWCCSDSMMIFRERWEKHFSDYLDDVPSTEATWFDPSKISDLYDSLKFDALHHRDLLEALFTDGTGGCIQSLHRLYELARELFHHVGPREYGTSRDERLRIGQQISGLLYEEILEDLAWGLTTPIPFTRLYFTKESHMTALLNLLCSSTLPLFPEKALGELDYLSHLCFELYEKKLPDETSRYSLRIGISNGAHSGRLLELALDERHSLSVGPRRWLTDYLEGKNAIVTLRNNKLSL